MNFVSSHLQGGLGNYLFQIAVAFSISKRDSKILKIDISDISIIHSPLELYTNNILRKINFDNINHFDFIHRTHHVPITYVDIPVISGNIKLDGYYQNEKYFKEFKNDIFDLYDIDTETENYLNQKYSTISFENTCSIHVRRGNYVAKQNFHPLQTVDYYKKAIEIIGESKLFLIFSDDIEWCKNNLDFINNKIFITGNLDYQDLYLMSKCENNIIANSTFSWWGAYLNKNNNKKVIFPSFWFNNGPDSSEIGAENWIKL